jgi:hypothetical protein
MEMNYSGLYSDICLTLKKNAQRVTITRFRKQLRHKFLAAVRQCFDEYNEKGGAIVRMQDANLVYFPRACIYAIYADAPVATKCALTIKACPVCYTKEVNMATDQTNNLVYRTDKDMALKKKNFKTIMENNTTTKTRRDAGHLAARQLGIDMFTSNAFTTKPEHGHSWVFEPDPEKDCVWQSLPQVTFHGFDEGLCQKLNFAMLEMAVTEAHSRLNMAATEVS